MRIFRKSKVKTNHSVESEKTTSRSFEDEGFLRIGNFAEHDVFVAGFPKSGNTWMQNILTCMLLDTTTGISPRLVNDIVPDVHARQYYKRYYERMFFKTHALPDPSYKKVIHLVRDGRDAMVSFFHYKRLNNEKGFTFEEMIIEGKGVWPCSWQEHTEAWMENPFESDILVIRYEDLLTDPIPQIRAIAEFADISISDDRIGKIVTHNSLSTLRQKVQKSGWDYDKRFGSDSKNFFRKGKINVYKEEMPKEMIELFTQKARPMLEAFNYEVS